jgi:hypothetical protein
MRTKIDNLEQGLKRIDYQSSGMLRKLNMAWGLQIGTHHYTFIARSPSLLLEDQKQWDGLPFEVT